MNEVKENTVTASHKIEIYRGSRKHPKRMSYDATWEIKDRFKAMSKIIDELFLLAEKYINAQALPAGEFILDEDSAQQCLKTDLNRFFNGQTDGIELRYTAELGNDTFTIVAKANVNDDKVFYRGRYACQRQWKRKRFIAGGREYGGQQRARRKDKGRGLSISFRSPHCG